MQGSNPPGSHVDPASFAGASASTGDALSALTPPENLSATLVFGTSAPEDLSRPTLVNTAPGSAAPSTPSSTPGAAAAAAAGAAEFAVAQPNNVQHNTSDEAPATARPGSHPSTRKASSSSGSFKDDACLVCLADNMPATIRLTCCNAAAHIHCLSRWLKRSQLCPHCRAFLREPEELRDDSDGAATSTEEDDDLLMDGEEDAEDAAAEGMGHPERTAEPIDDELERNFRRFQRRMRAPRASPRPSVPVSLMPSQNGSLAGAASGATSPQPPPGPPPPLVDGTPVDAATPPRWFGGYRTNTHGPSVSMEDLTLADTATVDADASSPFNSGSFAAAPPPQVPPQPAAAGAARSYSSSPAYHPNYQPQYQTRPSPHGFQQQQRPSPQGAGGPQAPPNRNMTPPVHHPRQHSGGGFPMPSTSPHARPTAAPYAAQSAPLTHSGSGASTASGYVSQSMPAVLRRDGSNPGYGTSGLLVPQHSFQADSFASASHRQHSMQSLHSEYVPGGGRQLSVNDSFAREGAYRPNPHGPTQNPIE